MEFKNPYGFIYITTNLVNGKRYIGQKKLDNRSRWKSYLGSGTHLIASIKKYGKENFSRNIVAFGYSSEELNEMEYDCIDFMNAVKNTDFYNQVDGGYALNEYVKKKSISCIDILTGKIFSSIVDASNYVGCSETPIKNSFKRVHNYDFMDEFPVFRPLDSIKNIDNICCICGKDDEKLSKRNDKKVQRCSSCNQKINEQLKNSKKTKSELHKLGIDERKLCKKKNKKYTNKKIKTILNPIARNIEISYNLGMGCENIASMINIPEINAKVVREKLKSLGVYKGCRGNFYYAIRTNTGEVYSFQYLKQLLRWINFNLYKYECSDQKIIDAINKSILNNQEYMGAEFNILNKEEYSKI